MTVRPFFKQGNAVRIRSNSHCRYAGAVTRPVGRPADRDFGTHSLGKRRKTKGGHAQGLSGGFFRRLFPRTLLMELRGSAMRQRAGPHLSFCRNVSIFYLLIKGDNT